MPSLECTTSCEHVKATIGVSDESEILFVSTFQSIGFRSLRIGRSNTLRNLFKVFSRKIGSIDDGTELRYERWLAFANRVPVYSRKEGVGFDLGNALAADTLICGSHHPIMLTGQHQDKPSH